MPDRHGPAWLPRGMPEQAAALYVGLSVSTVRSQVRAGEFPPPVRLTKGRQVFLREDLDSYLDRKAGRLQSVVAEGQDWMEA